MNKDAYQIGTETHNGRAVGRDPRDMKQDELESMGHSDQPLSKIIRAKCKDCCSGDESEIRKCTAVSCPLWPYRMNKNPFRTRELSEEQRAVVSERFRKIREQKAVVEAV